MDRVFRYDHYKVLGIPRDADARTIKHAYRQKAKNVHPDRNGDPAATRVFRAVAEAYEVLGDPARRARYDGLLRHCHPLHAGAPPRRQHHHAASPRTYPARGQDRTFVPAWVFLGLHLTGLAFGTLLLFGTGWLVISGHLNWASMILTAPSWFLVPDSVEGLMMRREAMGR